MMPLLSLRLTVAYRGQSAVLRGLELDVRPGEIVGLVGPSGSGKSSLALAVMGLLRLKQGHASGHVLFRGEDLLRMPEKRLRGLRGARIALVPQSPVAALNPALRIGAQLAEAWRAHRGSRPPHEHLLDALEQVSLPPDSEFLRLYPRELSVGQAQRVMIAMAVLHHPPLLIADEPTSALDAITHGEILSLLERLNERLGMSILFISHDLLSVASFCHRVAILHEGAVVEIGPAREVFAAPRHPYTARLVAALARFAPDARLEYSP